MDLNKESFLKQKTIDTFTRNSNKSSKNHLIQVAQKMVFAPKKQTAKVKPNNMFRKFTAWSIVKGSWCRFSIET